MEDWLRDTVVLALAVLLAWWAYDEVRRITKREGQGDAEHD